MRSIVAIYLSRHRIFATRATLDRPVVRLGRFGITTPLPQRFVEEAGANFAIFDLDLFNPQSTLESVLKWIVEGGIPHTICVASYGPLDPHGSSVPTQLPDPIYSAPVLEAERFFTERLGSRRNAPRVVVHKDVAACALGEFYLRHLLQDTPESTARPTKLLSYIVFGFGVGVGFSLAGRPLDDRMLPEVGHLPVRPKDGELHRRLGCQHHDHCLIGMSSIEALNRRLLRKREHLFDPLPFDLEPDILETQAFYMAQLCTLISYVLDPDLIVIGGETIRINGMLQAVRQSFRQQKFGGQSTEEAADRIQTSIVPHGEPGLFGALLLGASAK